MTATEVGIVQTVELGVITASVAGPIKVRRLVEAVQSSVLPMLVRVSVVPEEEVPEIKTNELAAGTVTVKLVDPIVTDVAAELATIV